jgi:hypothetical protein
MNFLGAQVQAQETARNLLESKVHWVTCGQETCYNMPGAYQRKT